jgi:hypothetical protein
MEAGQLYSDMNLVFIIKKRVVFKSYLMEYTAFNTAWEYMQGSNVRAAL